MGTNKNLEINLVQSGCINHFCQTPVLGLGLGVDFTFALDNNHNHNDNNNDDNPPLNFSKGTVLGVKEQGIRDKG